MLTKATTFIYLVNFSMNVVPIMKVLLLTTKKNRFKIQLKEFPSNQSESFNLENTVEQLNFWRINRVVNTLSHVLIISLEQMLFILIIWDNLVSSEIHTTIWIIWTFIQFRYRNMKSTNPWDTKWSKWRASRSKKSIFQRNIQTFSKWIRWLKPIRFRCLSHLNKAKLGFRKKYFLTLPLSNFKIILRSLLMALWWNKKKSQ